MEDTTKAKREAKKLAKLVGLNAKGLSGGDIPRTVARNVATEIEAALALAFLAGQHDARFRPVPLRKALATALEAPAAPAGSQSFDDDCSQLQSALNEIALSLEEVLKRAETAHPAIAVASPLVKQAQTLTVAAAVHIARVRG